MRVIHVLEKLTQALVTVESRDGRLHVRALLDERPLNAETLALCREYKAELLAYVEFARQADTLLLESTRRLARAWPPGCHLDEDERWAELEQELHHTYWSLDLTGLQGVIAVRERVALEVFAAYRKEPAI